VAVDTATIPQGDFVLQTMQQRMRAARENEKGFTLIELLIVIVILGVLAGIVVFSVQFIQDRGAHAACVTDRKTVQSAVEAYFAQNNAYPSGIGNGIPGDPGNGPTTLTGAGILKDTVTDVTLTVPGANPPYTLSNCP
jgi:general secretion pathway protein G